jgi:hypothetical protein
VLLASPTNLVAICRTVAQVWRQDGLAREARDRPNGRRTLRSPGVAAEHLKRVGSGLESAVTNYNKFVGSFERNVLSAGRRLREHIEIGKREVEEVPSSKPRPAMAPAILSRNWPRPMALALQGNDCGVSVDRMVGLPNSGAAQAGWPWHLPCACASCLPARTGPAGERQPDCQPRRAARSQPPPARQAPRPTLALPVRPRPKRR